MRTRSIFEEQKRRLIIPFLAPFTILYVVFWAFPVVQSLPAALSDWNGLSSDMRFTGLRNFQVMAQDPVFWQALANTFIFMAITLPSMAFSLLFAVILTTPIRFRSMVKVIIFAPALVSIVVLGLLWSMIYDPNIGLLNNALRAVGLSAWAQPWLGRAGSAMVAIAITIMWAGMGMGSILFLAGLQKIPKELYDAARIDGAGPWASFQHITWPLLWDITRILVLLHIIGSMQAFIWQFVLTGGGPVHATETLGIYLWRASFHTQGGRYGYAAAVGVAILVLVIGASILMYRLSRRETVEY